MVLFADRGCHFGRFYAVFVFISASAAVLARRSYGKVVSVQSQVSGGLGARRWFTRWVLVLHLLQCVSAIGLTQLTFLIRVDTHSNVFVCFSDFRHACLKWSSVAEWLECWTQVNFTRARGPGFDSWTDPSKKIARPQDSHVVTWPAGDQEKHDSLGLLLRSVAELYPGNIEILAWKPAGR